MDQKNPPPGEEAGRDFICQVSCWRCAHHCCNFATGRHVAAPNVAVDHPSRVISS